MSIPFAAAAAQTLPVPGDVAANTQQHIGLTRLASEHGVEWLVFPELSLIGYELELSAEHAFTQNDARLAPLIEAASRYAVTLVVGAPIQLAAKRHIGVFILSPERTVEIYTKRYLGTFSASASVDSVTPTRSVPPGEPSYFVPGDRDPLVRRGFASATFAICADANRRVHAQAAADRGTNLYLVSAFFIPSDIAGKHERLAGYAVQHCMTVVLSNYGGPTGGLASGGRSAIWNDQGTLVAELGANGSGLVICAGDRSDVVFP